MKALVFLGFVVLAVLAGMFFYARWAAKHHKASIFGMKGVRLNGEGQGWMYEYGWPRRKKRNEDPHQ